MHESVGVELKPDHGVDNLAMAISLVASTRGLSLMPAYAKNSRPWAVVSRPLEGRGTDDRSRYRLQQGKHVADLEAVLSRVDELIARGAQKPH